MGYMDSNEMGRRVRAARLIGGFRRAEDLADEIELGRNTLLKIERGERKPKRMELWAIAEACGVSLDFFEGSHRRAA